MKLEGLRTKLVPVFLKRTIGVSIETELCSVAIQKRGEVYTRANYRENTPRYGVRVSHSLRERLNHAIAPAIAKFLQKIHDMLLPGLIVAINGRA